MSTWILLLSAAIAAEPDAKAEAETEAETEAEAEAPEAASDALSAEPDSVPSVLYIDAKVPAEVLVDGVKLAQMWFPGKVSFQIETGAHRMRVYTNGQPSDYQLDVQPNDDTHVVVGRTGISLDTLAEVVKEDPAAFTPVEFRAIGGAAQVRLGKQRLMLSAGERMAVEIPQGQHTLSIRSADGTAIWATGTLEVGGGDRLVVQVTEGRLPEVSGLGRFFAGGG